MARKKLSAQDHSREVARMGMILKIFEREYPEAKCSLDFKNPFELLCATILSAQCTDERVNMTTPALFKKFPTPQAMAKAKLPELEKLIHSTGFYKNKAKSLKSASHDIVELHGGKVPGTLEELIELHGVGRKTANVVLGNIFAVPGLVVDTHVGRLSRRMGFTKETDPVKVEHEMMEIVPREKWTEFGHLMISHGRAICQARSPKCDECPIRSYCPRIGVA
jgi:endonuclease-3